MKLEDAVFSLLVEPQRGCALQPRVGASATLGYKFVDSPTAKRLRPL